MTILRMMRIVSILCALAFAGAGAMLAWHFFFFVKTIVEQPDTVVGRWQAVMAEARGPETETPEPEAVVPQPLPTPDPAAAPLEVGPEGAPAPGDAPPVEPAEVAIAPEAPAPPPSADPIVRQDDEFELFLGFADSVLDRFEKGQFSWLIGLGLLAIFCWVMGKVPAVMIATGAKVLVDLLNFDIKKS